MPRLLAAAWHGLRRRITGHGARGRPVLINRAAVIVHPRRAYRDWAGECWGVEDFEPAWMQFHASVYLVRFGYGRDDLKQWVEDNWPKLFTDQLSLWTTKPSLWPRDWSKAMFDRWFHVRVADHVQDVWRDYLKRDR